jgi:hypothetical protein
MVSKTKYPRCETENPDGMKCCAECGADGWVTKAEKELAALF